MQSILSFNYLSEVRLKNIYVTMKRLYLATFLALTMWCASANAQSYIQNTMFMYNRVAFNPAAVGAGSQPQLTLLGRYQWVGLDGAPRLFTLSGDGKIDAIRGGLGGYVIGDRLGPLSTIGANVAYAFHLELGDGGEDSNAPTLQIGVQAGVLQKAINGTFVYSEQIFGPDPVIPSGDYTASAIVPSLGAGVYLNGPDQKYYVGISAHDLLEPSLEGLLQTDVGEVSNVPRTFYIMGGYRFDFNNDKLHLQPNFMARTDGASFQFDIGANMTIDPIVIGLSHRWQDSFSGLVGFTISDRLFLAYSYDYTLSDLNANRDLHSHELVLSYRFSTGTKIPTQQLNVKDKFGKD